MDQDCPVTLSLSHDLLRAVGRAARGAALPPSVLVMRLLAQVLMGTGLEEARVRLALVTAAGWADLQARLRAGGFCLRTGAGDALDLCRWPSGEAVLPLTALGESREGLALRFGADLPPDGRQGARRTSPRAPPVAFASRRMRRALPDGWPGLVEGQAAAVTACDGTALPG